MNYRITQVSGWFVVSLSGKAENNEPLKVKYLCKRWLAESGIRVIVDLKEIQEFGVWEMGLLTSFKREMDHTLGHVEALPPRSIARRLLSERPLPRAV